MYGNLETYLEEISHYLVLSHGKQDVIAEIRSHILEKAGQEHGVVSEETVAKVISGYGSPQRVAARYMEGETLIAPIFKNYLLRYTGILFAIHVVVILAASLLKTSLVIFPFLYIPPLSNVTGLFYLPTAFIYDLGLVGIFFYFVSRHSEDVRLPWFHLGIRPSGTAPAAESESKGRQPESVSTDASEPKLYLLILMLAGYGALIWFFLRFQTLFLIGFGPDGPQPLFRPAVSQWYSLAVLALVTVAIGGYAARFFTRSEWINVAANALGLMIAGIVSIYPVEPEPSLLPFLSERTFGTVFVLIVAITNALGLLTSLFRIARKMLFGTRP